MNLIVFGLPGSGKSYFARELAKRVGAHYANTDVVRRQLNQESKYTPEGKVAVYETMLSAMEDAILTNSTIILDGTFYRDNIRSKFILKARMLNSPLSFIEVKASPEVIRERVEKPRPDSEADFEVYQKIKEEFQPLIIPHLVLRSDDNNVDRMINEAQEYLDRIYA